MRNNRGGVVVRLVEIDGGLADGVEDDGQVEGRDIGVKEAVEAAADAVVVARRELGGGQGRVVCNACLRPLGASIWF